MKETDLQKEIDRNRPKCSECKPIYVDLSDTLCGCVGITYLHQCRDVLVDEPSGMGLIVGLRSKRSAIDAASKVSEITDWTQPFSKVETPEVWKKLKPILMDLGMP